MALRGMKALQEWCRIRTQGYKDVCVKDMSKSWRDGLAFCAIIHKYRPDLIDFESLSKENIYDNNKLAFAVGEEELGIPALLEASDMVKLLVPDRLSIMTYVAQYYDYFKDQKPGMVGLSTPKKLHISSKRYTPPTSPHLQTKKFHEADEKDIKIKSSEHKGTISDRCAICKDKVYLLERHIQDGKSYHRSCFRQQHVNRPYTSVLQSPIKTNSENSPHKEDQHRTPIPKSKSADSRLKFFSEIEDNTIHEADSQNCDTSKTSHLKDSKGLRKLKVVKIGADKKDDSSKDKLSEAGGDRASREHTVNSDKREIDRAPGKTEKELETDDAFYLDDCLTKNESLLENDSFSYEFGLSALRKAKKKKRKSADVSPKTKSPKEKFTDNSHGDTAAVPLPKSDSFDILVEKNDTKTVPMAKSDSFDILVDKNEDSKMVSTRATSPDSGNSKSTGSEKPSVVDEVIGKDKFDQHFQYDSKEKKFVHNKVSKLDVGEMYAKKFGRSLEDLSSIDKDKSDDAAENEAPKIKKDHKNKEKKQKVEKKDKVPDESVDVVSNKTDKKACQICGDRVFMLEKKVVDGILYHKSCFAKWSKENTNISPGKADNDDKETKNILPHKLMESTDETSTKTEGIFKKKLKKTNMKNSVENLSNGELSETNKDAPKKEEKYKKKLKKTNMSKSVENLSLSESMEITEEAPKTEGRFKKKKTPDKSNLKKSNSKSVEHLVGDGESKLFRIPLNKSPQGKLRPVTTGHMYASPKEKPEEEQIKLYSRTPKQQDQTKQPWRKSENDVRFASDDDYNKLKDIKKGLFSPKSNNLPESRSKNDENAKEITTKPAKVEYTPKKKTVLDNKEYDKSADGRPEWQIEAERRAKLRGTGYEDPEKKKQLDRTNDKEQITETPKNMVRKNNAVNADLQKNALKTHQESKQIPSTPKSFRPLLHSSPAESSPKKSLAPLPPAQKRRVSAETRLAPTALQRELEDLDRKQTQLEEKGRELEHSLRKSVDKEDDDLLMQWFNLVNEKNRMVRRESEIIHISRAQQLEDEQAELEFELRQILAKHDSRKTSFEKEREEILLDTIVSIVEKRNEIVTSLDNDRIREAEEDKGIQELLDSDVFASHEDLNKKKKKKKGKAK